MSKTSEANDFGKLRRCAFADRKMQKTIAAALHTRYTGVRIHQDSNTLCSFVCLFETQYNRGTYTMNICSLQILDVKETSLHAPFFIICHKNYFALVTCSKFLVIESNINFLFINVDEATQNKWHLRCCFNIIAQLSIDLSPKCLGKYLLFPVCIYKTKRFVHKHRNNFNLQISAPVCFVVRILDKCHYQNLCMSCI